MSKPSSASLALLAGAFGLAGLGLSQGSRQRALRSYRNQTVLITGGSRGLGLAMARELKKAGAALMLCARDADELERAVDELGSDGHRVLGIPCDIRERDQVKEMIKKIGRFQGGIDVLINNAGIITVGPLQNQALGLFQDAMDTLFWGTVHCTLEVMPGMLERGQGGILNVTSIGGRVTIPHLLPYCCAKAACVAFSEGLRQELGPRGLRVLTAVPGLMRTGSFDNALFVGKQSRERRWFRLSSSLPGLTMPADRAAREMLVALARNRPEHRVTLAAQALAELHGLMPGLVNDLAGALGGSLLPQPEKATGSSRTGRELGSKAGLWEQLATILGRRAERSYQIHRSENKPKEATSHAR